MHIHGVPAVLNNYDIILKRAQAACHSAGRDFTGVNIMPVTKYAAAADIATLFGERNIKFAAVSRLQDYLGRWQQPPLSAIRAIKFYIGALQSNKTRRTLENFDFIGSLDNFSTAQRLSAQAGELGKQANCLLQLKLAPSATQGGVAMDDAPALIKRLKTLSGLNLRGLMAIAPQVGDQRELRPLFRKAKNLFDAYFSKQDFLSLGMSGDYETALQEGSNLPRIGGAIFGGDNDN